MSNKLKVGYDIISSLAEPLVARKKGSKRLTKTDLGRWISEAIGPCFDEESQGGIDYRSANHRWEDYLSGPFDNFFWSLKDLLPGEVFANVIEALSSNPRRKTIPKDSGHRKDENGYHSENGLSFYGLTSWNDAQTYATSNESGNYTPLEARYCLRGIGPNNELILRLRKIGTMSLKPNAPSNGFPFPKTTEEASWKLRVEGNLLDTINDTKSLQRETCIDCCVCLPYSISVSLLNATKNKAATAQTLINRFVETMAQGDDEAHTNKSLFSPFEQGILRSAPWPEDPIEVAKDITGMLILYELGVDDLSLFDAALELFDVGTGGALAFAATRQPPYLENVARWRNEIQERNPQFRNDDHQDKSFNDGFVRPAFRGLDPAEWLASPPDDEKHSRGLIIQANSGMGKTTFVRGLAAACAKARLDDTLGEGITDKEVEAFLSMILSASEEDLPAAKKTLASLIPIIIAQPVDSENYSEQYAALDAEPVTPFVDLIYQLMPLVIQSVLSFNFKDTYETKLELFKSILKTKEVLLLVDSIDEVPIDYRIRYLERLDAFIREYDIKRFIVTSRPLPVSHNAKLLELSGGCKTTIQPFNKQQQKQLFFKMLPCKSFDGVPDANQLDNLFESIVSTKGFAQMMGNPLILTTIARNVFSVGNSGLQVLFDEIDRDLPKFRELYDYDKLVLWHLAYDMTVDALGHRLSYNDFIDRFNRYRTEEQLLNRGNTETIGCNTAQAAQDAPPKATATEVIDRTIMRRGILVLHDGGYVEFEFDAIKAFLASKWVINNYERSVLSSKGEPNFEAPLRLARQLIETYAESMNAETPNDAALMALLFILNYTPYGKDNVFNQFKDHLYREIFGYCLFSDENIPSERNLLAAAESIIRESNVFQLGNPIVKPAYVETWQERLSALSDPHR